MMRVKNSCLEVVLGRSQRQKRLVGDPNETNALGGKHRIGVHAHVGTEPRSKHEAVVDPNERQFAALKRGHSYRLEQVLEVTRWTQSVKLDFLPTPSWPHFNFSFAKKISVKSGFIALAADKLQNA